MRTLALLLFAALAASASGQELDCAVNDFDKIDCGFVGSTEDSCVSEGCCWEEVNDGGGTPWCFFAAGEGGNDICELINLHTEDGPGFDQTDYDNMKQRY